MANIELYKAFDNINISGENYVADLLDKACGFNLLTDAELENIQIQCIELLARRTEKYNGGESSSIRVEAAESIMKSNLYTIGVHLKSMPNSAALEAIKSIGAHELYRFGEKRIEAKLCSARHFYDLLLKNRIQTENLAYNATIDEGIKAFFESYRPDFEAHESPGSIDYPIYIPVTDLTGVEYMLRYTESLYFENEFCEYFADLHHLFCGYDENYKDLLINLYGIVLKNALGCVLIGSDPVYTDISEAQVRRLGSGLTCKSREEIGGFFEDAENRLSRIIGIEGKPLGSYIKKSLPQISTEICCSLENGTFEHELFEKNYPENDYKISFSFGEKMEDEKYRILIGELFQCRYPEDKISIVKNNIKSLSDIEDVLFDAEFTDDEIITILVGLEMVEAAALACHCHYNSEFAAADEREVTLRRCLHKFIENQPEYYRKQINLLIQQIKEE